MLKKLVFIFVISFFILSLNVDRLFAMDHEIIHPVKGSPIGWENQKAIPYWTDLGPLGELTNIQASALVDAMIGIWESVETADIKFIFKGNLNENVNEDNFYKYLNMTSCGSYDDSDIPADVVPIIFDEDGKIFENLLGEGSSGEIGGLASLRCFNGTDSDPKAIHQGMVVINGQFVDGLGEGDKSPEDLSINIMAGVILHELGHLLGLGHSVINEEIYFGIMEGNIDRNKSRFIPTMLPTVLRESTSATTLHPDDTAALSILYPKGDYNFQTGEISGQILSSRGEKLRKVNVIARKLADPLCEAYSSVTGRRCVPLVDFFGNPSFNSSECDSKDMYGSYFIEGLIPGRYTVEINELEDGWMDAGMYPSIIDSELIGDAEFYNIGDRAEEDRFKSDTIDVFKGEITEGINIVTSDSEVSDEYESRMPITGFIDGEGVRCKNDIIDYSKWLESVGGSLSSALNSDLNNSVAGGCSLVGSKKEKVGVLMFTIFIISLVFIFIMRRKKIISLISLSLLLFSTNLFAISVVPTNVEKMSLKAGSIFYGKCTGVSTQKNEQGILTTKVKYDVYRSVKGDVGREMEFNLFGSGSSEGGKSSINGIMRFYEGREDILFLYKESSWGFTSPVGLWQGAFPVVNSGEGSIMSKSSKAYKNISRVEGSDEDLTPDQFLDQIEDILSKKSSK